MKRLKHRIQIGIMVLFVLGLGYSFYTVKDTPTAFNSLIGLFVVMFIGQIFHECLHSLASRVMLKDWGEVYFGIRKGFFYTAKPMNVAQFVIVSVTPFVIMESFFGILYLLGGRYFLGRVDIIPLLLAVLGACVSDIGNIVTHLIYSKKIKKVTLSKPKNITVEMRDTTQIL